MSDPMKTRSTWQRNAIEAIVIVGSILLAFGIDAWWQERGERIEGQRVLVAVGQDLSITLDNLELWVELHSEALEATHEFLWMVGGEGQVPEVDQAIDPSGFYRGFAVPVSKGRSGRLTWSVMVPDPVIGRTINTLSFDPVTANLELLLASGDLSFIRNTSLRQALASLPPQLADARDEELIVKDLVLGRLNPLLDRSGNLVRPNLYRRFWAGLPPGALVEVSEIEGSPLLANLLASKAHLESHAVEALQDVGVSVREILEMIESELN